CNPLPMPVFNKKAGKPIPAGVVPTPPVRTDLGYKCPPNTYAFGELSTIYRKPLFIEQVGNLEYACKNGKLTGTNLETVGRN
ncbi:hypothetical protein PMAYCL1PPCAC_04841, partial [Pristionchus mayeri]